MATRFARTTEVHLVAPSISGGKAYQIKLDVETLTVTIRYGRISAPRLREQLFAFSSAARAKDFATAKLVEKSREFNGEYAMIWSD